MDCSRERARGNDTLFLFYQQTGAARTACVIPLYLTPSGKLAATRYTRVFSSLGKLPFGQKQRRKHAREKISSKQITKQIQLYFELLEVKNGHYCTPNLNFRSYDALTYPQLKKASPNFFFVNCTSQIVTLKCFPNNTLH